jgi:hypothetical protein
MERETLVLRSVDVPVPMKEKSVSDLIMQETRTGLEALSRRSHREGSIDSPGLLSSYRVINNTQNTFIHSLFMIQIGNPSIDTSHAQL